MIDGSRTRTTVTAALLRPETLLIVLLFLLLTRLSDLYRPPAGPLSLNQLVVALLVVFVVLRSLLAAGQALVKDRALAWILLYTAATLLSSVAAIDPPTAVASTLTFLREVLIVFVLVNLVKSVRDLRLASWALVAGGAVLAAAGAADLVSGLQFGGLSSRERVELLGDALGTRLAGSIGNANDFAAMLALAALLLLYLVWGEQRIVLRAAALAALLLSSVVIAWTYSRSGALALFVAVGVAAAMQRKPAHLLVAGLVLAAFVLAGPRAGWSRFEAAAHYAGEKASGLLSGAAAASPPTSGVASDRDAPEDLRARLGVLQVATWMFLDHPLTGIGKGNYPLLYGHYAWRFEFLPLEPKMPHNSLIHIAAETGLIGLLGYISVVVVTVVGARQGKRVLASAGRGRDALLLEAIEVAIYAYLVANLFQDDDLIRRRYLWILIGLAIAGRQVALRVAANALPNAELGAGAGALLAAPSAPKAAEVA